MKELMDILTFAALLGSGLVAGIFFAFSTFVMRALGQLPQNQGISAMKAINVTVLNPWFFLAFFGTGAVCLLVAFLALGSSAGMQRAYLLAGCSLYLLGCLLVTMAFNVPLNDRLASADPDSSGAEALWAHYLSRWTLWNHVRTAAPLAAAGLFTMALCGGK
ncbi:MAG: DUF1772 domain-containing protein [Planctomycetota bacterium]|nr:DUF1772 domain-containing protein [Planctomycetota bacterium]